MTLNINGLIQGTHAEFSHSTVQLDEFVLERKSIKSLLEDLSMIEIINIIDDETLIDKINILQYKESIAKKETGNIPNPYQVVNRYGYAGKYQFGKSALRTLRDNKLIDFDIDRDGEKVFINDSLLQEQTLNALILYNLNYIKKKNLYRYVGKKINGTRITVEGMLAGSHLVGVHAVSHFLENNGSMDDFYIYGKLCRKYDGNGVSLIVYMKLFEHV